MNSWMPYFQSVFRCRSGWGLDIHWPALERRRDEAQAVHGEAELGIRPVPLERRGLVEDELGLPNDVGHAMSRSVRIMRSYNL